MLRKFIMFAITSGLARRAWRILLDRRRRTTTAARTGATTPRTGTGRYPPPRP